MVTRLLGAGVAVVGHNRTRTRALPLQELGMAWAESPGAVAAATDVVCTMLRDTEALAQVFEGPRGLLEGAHEGLLCIEMSSVSPTYVCRLSGQLASRGASLLDAPVSGSVAAVEAGELSFIVGGNPDDLLRASPVLSALGTTVTHVGPVGCGSAMKTAANLNVAVQMLAFAESVVLAERSGIRASTAIDVLLASVIASPMLKYRGPFVLDPPAVPWFTIDMMQKDLMIALERARELQVPLSLTAVSNELLTVARAQGFGNTELASVVQVLEELSGERRRIERAADGPSSVSRVGGRAAPARTESEAVR